MIFNQLELKVTCFGNPTPAVAMAILYFKKGKVFYGQEPPSVESTNTECGVNCNLLAVIYWSSPMGYS